MEPKTALLVIDMQNDFLEPEGPLSVSGGKDIIDPIVDLMTNSKYNWDAVVLTKDWHPPNHISFAEPRGEGYKPYMPISVPSPAGNGETMQQTLWPVHAVQETKGAAVTEKIQIAFDLLEKGSTPTLEVLKGTMEDREYYSCFKDVWGIHKTECCRFLKDHKIENVVVVGLAYDYCVYHSSVDSAGCGFRTTVLKDLSRAVDAASVAETDSKYAENNVVVSTQAEWLGSCA